MGRRAKGHTYVRYILLLDKNGQIGKRHELDNHGKLKYPLDNIPQINLNTRRQTTNQTQNEKKDNQMNESFRFPLPPMLRSKMNNLSFFNFNWNITESPISEQNIEMPNVIDVRPKKLLEVQLS